MGNYVRFRLSPEVAIALGARAKRPGEEMVGRAGRALGRRAAAQGADGRMDAYERLLGDAMNGDATLFARQDVVEAAWAIVDPVIHGPSPMYEYEPGTWGPPEADALVEARRRLEHGWVRETTLRAASANSRTARKAVAGCVLTTHGWTATWAPTSCFIHTFSAYPEGVFEDDQDWVDLDSDVIRPAEVGHEYTERVVWLVGAGFSKALGAPLFKEMFHRPFSDWVNAWLHWRSLDPGANRYAPVLKLYESGIMNGVWSNPEECLAIVDQGRKDELTRIMLKRCLGVEAGAIHDHWAKFTQYAGIATLFLRTSRERR